MMQLYGTSKFAMSRDVQEHEYSQPQSLREGGEILVEWQKEEALILSCLW
jgi:hypothetical protein